MHDLAWFPAFAKALVQRSGRSDWQKPASEYWVDFERSLFGVDCTEEQADRASREVCDLPNLFPSDYRPKILEAIRRIKLADANAPMGQANGTREQAVAASKDCPECGGTGISARYVHADNRDQFRGAPIGTSIAGYCGTCPHGVYLAQKNTPDDRKPQTWADRPGLAHPCKAFYRPSQWDEKANRPHPDPDPAVIFDRSTLSTLAKRPRIRQDGPTQHQSKRWGSRVGGSPEGKLGPFPNVSSLPSDPPREAESE